jgi:hypothetical protein
VAWVHLAHAAFAQLRRDAVMRDGLLRAHRQIWGEWVLLSGRIMLLGSNLLGSNLGCLLLSGR